MVKQLTKALIMKRRKTAVLPIPQPAPYIVRAAGEVLTEENEVRGVLAKVNIFYRDGLLSRQYRQFEVLRDGTFRLYRDASDAVGVVVNGNAPLILRKRGEYVGAVALEGAA
jgi:hypothetical protein